MTSPAAPSLSPMERQLARYVSLEPGELAAALWSFAYFFCVLCAYYILRPVRDAMGVTVGQDGQKWLFTIVFLVMLAAVPLFGWLVSRYPRRDIVPIVYVFFIANILAFWLLMDRQGGSALMAATFFVWLSVFNLFVVSLFWSFMADHYSSEQAKRLYGFIAAGGSIGVLTGASLTKALVDHVGVANLLLLSALVLTAGLGCALVMRRLLESRGAEAEHGTARPTVAATLAGASRVWEDPYLFRIAMWVLLANLVGTYFYIEEQRIVGAALSTKAEQVAYFSGRDRTFAVLQILCQLVLTGYLLRRFSLGLCAATLPVTAIVGLGALAIAPTLWVVYVVMIAERVVAFGIANPATKVLWTVVAPDDKYKAQNFIDTVVYRGGDAASSWAVNGLTRSLGLPLAAVAALGVPLAVVWRFLTYDLGRRQAARAGDVPADAAVGSAAKPA